MPTEIQQLVNRLLGSTGAGNAKPIVDELVQALCRITQVDLHPTFFNDESATLTPQGKAVSLVTAAQCAEDVERTRVFIQGVHTAICSRVKSQQYKSPIRILYAGTGPFGLLLIPLLPLFAQENLKVFLLDIHSESLEKLQGLIDYLNVGHLIATIEQADACQWQTSEKFDLVISETMRQGLIQEPQVSVFAHLHQFLAEDGLLIPEIIRLDIWLARAGVEHTPIFIGKLFQLDKELCHFLGKGDVSLLQGSLSIPDYPAQLCDLKLTTSIQVFGQHKLYENQSQLTLPIYEKNAKPIPDSELRYQYMMGNYPQCRLHYSRSVEQELIALPDICEPNTQGIFHLKRLWEKVQYQKSAIANVRSQVAVITQQEWLLDRVLFDSLGLGLEPVFEQLYRSNHLAEFESWLGAANGEAFAADNIAHANSNILLFLQGKSVASKNIPEPLSKEQLAWWDENGYLIVPGVLDVKECANAREALWEFLGMKEDDPTSWYRSSADMKKIMVQMFDHPSLDVARQSQYIHNIFKQLWQRDELILITDRVSFNPPETGCWKFPGPGMHWDVELKAPISFATQGLIYLTDVAENQGAFCCVPGFHKKIDQWLRELPEGGDPAQQDWSQWNVKPVAAKAGDLIIWHQALPHGSSANRAHYPRMVQYINMYR